MPWLPGQALRCVWVRHGAGELFLLGLVYFVPVLGVGRAPCAAGGAERLQGRAGAPSAPALPSANPLCGCSRASRGFWVGAQEPGALPRGPLEALLWAGTTEGRPMSRGCSKVRAAPAPPHTGPGPCPVAHAHSPAASAFGSRQLCPPGDNQLLLLLLLQSPPQPSGDPGAIPASLSPALCPQSAALHSRHQPSPSVSLAATSPSLRAWAGTGRERRGPGTPPGAAGGSRFAPSHHLTSI